MIVGVATETFPGERRVALIPELVSKLIAAGLEVHMQSGAGVEAGTMRKGELASRPKYSLRQTYS